MNSYGLVELLSFYHKIIAAIVLSRDFDSPAKCTVQQPFTHAFSIIMVHEATLPLDPEKDSRVNFRPGISPERLHLLLPM